MNRVKRLIICIVLVLAAGLGMTACQKLDKPIDRVVVNGDFYHLKEKEVINLIDQKVKDGFLSLNLSGLNKYLESEPWIRNATIRRSWPSTIIVDITEEKPIARWGEKQVLNNVGDYLEITDKQSIKNLPTFTSEFGESKEMIKSYQLMSEIFGPTGLKVQEIRRDVVGSWLITTSSGIQINLGRDQLVQKLRRFQVVWSAQLSSQVEKIKTIDMRYPNGISVAWNQDDHI
ncbi:cell division protein FtsQ/DivIB [Gammaproteobacteria bacterium]|nr:cell division protein FtsQ/DivIB [Gammaproteobacteria bacterium]